MNRLLSIVISILFFQIGVAQKTFLKPLFDTKTPQARHSLNDVFELKNGNFLCSKSTSGTSGYTSTSLILYSDSIKEIKRYPLAYHYKVGHYNTTSNKTVEVLPNTIFAFGSTYLDTNIKQSLGYSEIYNDTFKLLWGEYDTSFAIGAAPISDTTFVTLHVDSVSKRISLRKYNQHIQLLWEVIIDSFLQKVSLSHQDLAPMDIFTSNNDIFIRYGEKGYHEDTLNNELLFQCNSKGKYLQHTEYNSSGIHHQIANRKRQWFQTTLNHKIWFYRKDDKLNHSFSFGRAKVFNQNDSLLFEVVADSNYFEEIQNAVELENGTLVFAVTSSDNKDSTCNGRGFKLVFYSPEGKHLRTTYYPSNEISWFSIRLEEGQGNSIICNAWASVSSTGHGLAFVLKLDSIGHAFKDYQIMGKTHYFNPPITQLKDSCWKSNTVGVEEIQSEEIKIYPNPTSGIVNVKGLSSLNPIHITIFNAAGQKTTSFSTSCFNVSNLEPGMYFMKIIDGAKTQSLKLIVEH